MFNIFAWFFRYLQPSSESSAMNINDLPSDVLLLILQKLSLEERIHLRGVCIYWFSLIEEMCHRTHSLILLGSERNITDYCLTLINDNTFDAEKMRLKVPGHDNDLIIDGVNPKICFTFTDLFPNLESLTIHLSWDCHFETLRLWVMQFPALKSLTICGFIEHQEERFLERFLPTLNSLDSLTSLHFLATNFFLLPNGDSSPIELPQVMSNQTAFSIANYSGNLYHLLRQLNADKCRRLRIDLMRSEENEVEVSQLITFNRTLMGNLTHLRLSLPNSRQTNELIPVICQNLVNLSHLDLQSCAAMDFGMIKIDSNFIEEINRLTNLCELRVSHVGIDLLAFDFETAQIAQVQVLHLSQVTIYPENQLLGSSLYITTSTDPTLWRSLSFLFPRLEQLFVRVKKASIAPIEELVGKFFENLQICQIYSVEDKVADYFGRHSPSDEQPMEFFSEYFFDKIRHL